MPRRLALCIGEAATWLHRPYPGSPLLTLQTPHFGHLDVQHLKVRVQRRCELKWLVIGVDDAQVGAQLLAVQGYATSEVLEQKCTTQLHTELHIMLGCFSSMQQGL